MVAYRHSLIVSRASVETIRTAVYLTVVLVCSFVAVIILNALMGSIIFEIASLFVGVVTDVLTVFHFFANGPAKMN